MKVSRQNLTESYNTTVDWVNDFSSGLTKESDYLNNLKNILNKRKDFSTIEEKMADIRARAGFELVKNLKSEDSNIKEAGSCAPHGKGCDSCESCTDKDSANNDSKARMIRLVTNLLDHLKQRNDHLSKNRKDKKGVDSIIFYCRNSNADLGFQEIESAIPIDKLKSIISNYLELSDCKGNSQEEFAEKAVPYIPEECDSSESTDDTADYFRHALTSG